MATRSYTKSDLIRSGGIFAISLALFTTARMNWAPEWIKAPITIGVFAGAYAAVDKLVDKYDEPDAE